MNVRQSSFAELVASGIPASRAYFEAGYSSRGKNAESNASRLLENPDIANRIAELRSESRKMSKMTKAGKLKTLESIIVDKTARTSDRIAAIKIHNCMVGDNEPTVTVVETGPSTMDMVRQRAREMASPLSLIKKKADA